MLVVDIFTDVVADIDAIVVMVFYHRCCRLLTSKLPLGLFCTFRVNILSGPAETEPVDVNA